MMIDIIKICSIFGEDTTLFGHYPPSSSQTNAPRIRPMYEDCVVRIFLAAPRSHVPSPRFRMVGVVVPPSTFRQLTLNKRKLSYPPHQFLVILSHPGGFIGQPPSSPAGNCSYALVDCCVCPFGWVGGLEGEIRPSTATLGGPVLCVCCSHATPAMI